MMLCKWSVLQSRDLCFLSEYEYMNLNRSMLCSSKELGKITPFGIQLRFIELADWRMRLENRILEMWIDSYWWLLIKVESDELRQ